LLFKRKTVGSAHTREPLKRLDPNFDIKTKNRGCERIVHYAAIFKVKVFVKLFLNILSGCGVKPHGLSFSFSHALATGGISKC
jgi:hypothetical protein